VFVVQLHPVFMHQRMLSAGGINTRFSLPDPALGTPRFVLGVHIGIDFCHDILQSLNLSVADGRLLRLTTERSEM
jgi:hypothetical protein